MEYCHGTFFGILYIVVNNQNHIIERKLSRMVVCLVGFSFCTIFDIFLEQGAETNVKRMSIAYILSLEIPQFFRNHNCFLYLPKSTPVPTY